MSKDKCPLEPDPLYKEFPGVYPDPYRKASGSWAMRYRFNVGTSRKTIAGDPGSDEFRLAYHALKAATANNVEIAAPLSNGKIRTLRMTSEDDAKGRSLDWLIGVYFGSTEFENLGRRVEKLGQPAHNRNKRRDYLTAFANALTPRGRRYGSGPFEQVDKKAVELFLNGVRPLGRHRGMDGKPKGYFKGGKSVRDAHLSAIRVLFNWALEKSLTALANPAALVEKKYKAEGHKAFNADHRRKFCERWSHGTMPRLAYELLFATGARRSDVIRFGDDMVGRDGVLRWVETKGDDSEVDGKHAPSSKPNECDLSDWPELRAHIRASVKEIEAQTGIVTLKAGVWLRNASGRKFGYGDFGHKWKRWCRLAGVPDMNVHGMRAGGAVDMLNATGNLAQVSAFLNHTNLATTEIYLRGRDRPALAKKGRAALRKAST